MQQTGDTILPDKKPWKLTCSTSVDVLVYVFDLTYFDSTSEATCTELVKTVFLTPAHSNSASLFYSV